MPSLKPKRKQRSFNQIVGLNLKNHPKDNRSAERRPNLAKIKRVRKSLPDQEFPPLGYYDVSNNTSHRKSLVNMSKQLTTCRTAILRPQRQSKEKELEQTASQHKVNQVSTIRVQEWIRKEMQGLKEIESFQRKPVRLDNKFSRLFELTALKLKNQATKSYL